MQTSVPVDAIVERLVQWLREEVAPIVGSGANWKVIIHGSAAGDVRSIVEKHDIICKPRELKDVQH